MHRPNHSTYTPRPVHIPMDIDEPDPNPRLGEFAEIQQENQQRKRLHIDMDTPERPIRLSSSSTKIAHVTPNTPFLFHAALHVNSPSGFHPQPMSTPSTSFQVQHPPGSSGFNIGSTAFPPRVEIEDVEMYSDSPARSSTSNGAKPEAHAGGEEHAVQSEEGAEPETKGPMEEQKKDAVEERRIASGAVSRVRKKRQQQDWKRSRRRGSNSDDEQRHSSRQLIPQSSRSEHQHHYNFHVPTPALRHSEIPSLLLAYLQFFVNAAIVVFMLYLAVQLVLTVRRDVQDRMQEVSMEILQEIAECSTLYLTNRCEPSLRVPAMEAPCKAWETCMNRDPTFVGRSNVLAETFAGVINTFVETISWKTMAFTLVTLSFLIILTNSALWNLRSKVLPSEPMQQQHVPGPFPPPQFMQAGLGAGMGHTQGIQGYDVGERSGVGQIGWNDGKKEKKGWW